jgi:hypothetical protein
MTTTTGSHNDCEAPRHDWPRFAVDAPSKSTMSMCDYRSNDDWNAAPVDDASQVGDDVCCVASPVRCYEDACRSNRRVLSLAIVWEIRWNS